MTNRMTILGLVGMSTVGLAASYLWQAQWLIGLLIIVVGGLWIVGIWRKVAWPASLGFIIFLLVAGFAVFNEISFLLIFICALSATLAWDLGHFWCQTQIIAVRQEARLREVHQRRLFFFLAVGLVCSLSVLWLETNVRPIWGIALGLFAVVALSRMVRYLRQESD